MKRKYRTSTDSLHVAFWVIVILALSLLISSRLTRDPSEEGPGKGSSPVHIIWEER